MATSLGFSLLLFVIYERTFHIEACYETMRCKGSDIELDFRHNRANSPIFTLWSFISTKNVTVLIAKKQSKDPTFESLYKNRSFIEHNKLFLGNVSPEDSGIYTREITDDSHDMQKYTDEVKLTVMLPPSSKPILHQERTKNGTLVLTCKPPAFLGNPEVKVVMKDSADNIQGPLSFTVNDNLYRCCLIGEASTCMEGNANKFRCATYNLTVNKLKEIKSDSTKNCNIMTNCLYYIGIPWLITFTMLKASGLIVLCKKNKFSLNGLKKSFQELVCNLLSLFEVLFSLIVMIIIMAFFCGDLQSCTFPNESFILFGMGSTLLLLIPELASNKLNTDRGQKNRRNSLNDDHL